jgi:LemA protein
MVYNNKIEMFPSNIFANMFHFKLKEFLEIEQKERENVKVKF